nr:GpE family phage tail protein [Yersinia enterocolitica]
MQPLRIAGFSGTGGQGDWFFVAETGGVTLDPKLEVDDLMADIAAIFHWPPSELWALSLTELVRWRHKALLRSGAVNNE